MSEVIEKVKKNRFNPFMLDAFDGFVIGGMFALAFCAIVFVTLELKPKKTIEKEMVERGYGFYSCDEKTGEVKFEYYKMVDLGEKVEKKGK
jgi:hypothetical protein